MKESGGARSRSGRETVRPVTPSGDLRGAARAGDHHAFTTLIRDADERMRRLAYRLLGSQAAMDDALQDSYLKAFRRIDSYDGAAAFSTWLYTIVYRTCLDHIRRRDRRAETGLADADATVRSGEADHASQTTDAAALEAALAELPPDQAAAVLLVDGEGLSYTEAAQILDCAEGTVASRLNRAHAALRRVLDPSQGGGPHE